MKYYFKGLPAVFYCCSWSFFSLSCTLLSWFFFPCISIFCPVSQFLTCWDRWIISQSFAIVFSTSREGNLRVFESSHHSTGYLERETIFFLNRFPLNLLVTWGKISNCALCSSPLGDRWDVEVGPIIELERDLSQFKVCHLLVVLNQAIACTDLFKVLSAALIISQAETFMWFLNVHS